MLAALLLACAVAMVAGVEPEQRAMPDGAWGSPYSPERALEIARRIQFHQVTLHRHHTTSGLSTLSAEQKELFDTLKLPTPTADAM